jgi:hypothetical protein
MKSMIALAFAAFAASAGAADAVTVATQPLAGMYNMVMFDQSQTGATCSGHVGGTSMGTFFYSGPGLTGSKLYQAKNTAGEFGFTIAEFPAAPASGVKAWKGTLNVTLQPGNMKKNVGFTATLTSVDTGHFLLLMKVNVDGCNQTKQLTLYSGSAGLGAAARGNP